MAPKRGILLKQFLNLSRAEFDGAFDINPDTRVDELS